MDAREQWQALQGRLIAARTFLDGGDRTLALAEVNAALDIDPRFLAAISLRERILTSDGQRSEATAPADPGHPWPEQPQPLMPAEGYARFEQQAKRRRADRTVEAARQALAQHRVRDAALALEEVHQLDPNLPELVDLTAAFKELQAPTGRRRVGPAFAAAAVVGAIGVGAMWLREGPVPLRTHPLSGVVDLVEGPSPAPLAAASIEDQPLAPRDVREPDVITARAAAPKPIPPPSQSSIALTSNPIPAVEPPPATPAPPPPAMAAPMPISPPVQDAILVPRPIPATALPGPRPAAVALFDADEAQVKLTLQRYRTAYDDLDAQSARAIYPAVNELALARAFDGLSSQTLTFDTCDVQLHGDGATATCRGSARYVPKVGTREPRTESRSWTFALRKSGSDWKIESARAMR